MSLHERMIEYGWRVSATNRNVAEVYAGDRSVGRLKRMEPSGAIAETDGASLSFRAAGLDPAKGSFLRRRLSHDAAIVHLGTGIVTASFSAGLGNKTLRFAAGAAYDWALSFFMTRATWRQGGEVAATISRSTISLTVDEESIESMVLAFFGLYLFTTGRGG
jgi:hypothetical protein